jgi:hypothetical protein
MPTQSPPFSGTTALVTQLGGELQVPEDLYRGIPIMALPPRIGFHASHEQFAPSELLALARVAEQAGFDCVRA